MIYGKEIRDNERKKSESKKMQTRNERARESRKKRERESVHSSDTNLAKLTEKSKYLFN